MKLKHLHIENYGRFSNYDYYFNDGVNEFCEENGFGKTTLASFIKAMFYGLPSYRSNTKEFNDRMHFYPFSGKRFGGNLTFIMDNKEYRIERYFDKKSDNADTLKVFCNDTSYKGFGNDIGKSVFGIDKESFERTVFIDSSAIDFGATTSISAKLNNLVDGLNGENTFQDAVDRLERAKKILKPARGSGGKITETGNYIFRLESGKSNITSISNVLGDKYNELNELNEKVRIAEEEKARKNEVNVVLQQWKTYDGYVEQRDEKAVKLSQLQKDYPEGLPSMQEAEYLKQLSRELEQIQSAGSATVFDGSKKNRLNELKEKFSEIVPTTESLDSIDIKIDDMVELEKDIEHIEREKNEDFSELDKKFSAGIPDNAKLEECESKFLRLREIENQINARIAPPSASISAPTEKKKKNTKMYIFPVISAIFIVCGIILLLLLSNKIAGGIILGVGAVLLIASSFIYFTNRNNTSTNVVVQDENLISLQAEKKDIVDKLYIIMAPLGYYSGNGAEYDYLAMKGDISRYLAAKDKEESNKTLLEQKKAELEEIRIYLSTFFKSFGMYGDNYKQNSRILHSEKSEYERLVTEESEIEAKRKKTKEEYDSKFDSFKTVLLKYNIHCSGDLGQLADRLYTDSMNETSIRNEAAEWQKKVDSYRSENGLSERPQEQMVDMGDIDATLAKYRNRIAQLENEISNDEAEVEKLDQLNSQLAEKTELLNEYKKKYDMLEATIELLKAAEQSLKDKYILPVKDQFVHYSDLIEKTLGEKVHMDKDFNLSFDREGANRSDRHLSAGQRSICALCFRLSLIDNMYTEEAPFIIMDDPFVNIDEDHLPQTLSLVKAISNDKQIVYFSCHSSRKISNYTLT